MEVVEDRSVPLSYLGIKLIVTTQRKMTIFVRGRG